MFFLSTCFSRANVVYVKQLCTVTSCPICGHPIWVRMAPAIGSCGYVEFRAALEVSDSGTCIRPRFCKQNTEHGVTSKTLRCCRLMASFAA